MFAKQAVPAIVTTTLLLLLSACASKPAARVELQSNALVIVPTFAVIEQPGMLDGGNLLNLIPVVGMLAVNARGQSRGEKLHTAFTNAGLNPNDAMQTALLERLQAKSVNVDKQTIEREFPSETNLYPDSKELPYGRAEQKFLDMRLSYGFAVSEIGGPYQPYVVANVIVVNAATHQSEYKESFGYNARRRGTAVKPADTLPSWESADAIDADIAGAIAALRAAFADVSRQIVDSLESKAALVQR